MPPKPCHPAVVISVPVYLGCKHFCALAHVIPGVQTLLAGEVHLRSSIRYLLCTAQKLGLLVFSTYLLTFPCWNCSYHYWFHFFRL